MNTISKLSRDYEIMISDVDFTKKLKLSAAFNYFQEVADMHADKLGIGLDTIMERAGVAWVLTRMKVDIIKYPVWYDKVVIETWPQIPSKFEFCRDYLMKDMEGNILVRAVSTWVILNVKTRELMKSEAIAIDYPPIITERAIDGKMGKIKPSGVPEPAYKRVIGCSDIDVNGHLNNSKYVDFIMDCFPVESYQKYCARSIQVNYLSEALPGDTVVMYKDVSGMDMNKIFIEGINEKDGKTIFQSQIDIAEV